MRFPLILCVIFIHYHGPEIDGATAYNTLRLLMYGVLTRAAVPAFFVISGYYFFHGVSRFTPALYAGKLKKRARTLLLPYVLWNLLALGSVVAVKVAAHFIKGRPLSDALHYIAAQGYLNIFWSASHWPGVTTLWGATVENTGPYLLPFWYVRDLMVFVLLTPLVYRLLRTCGAWLFAPLTVCYATGLWPHLPGFSASILFFAFGAHMALRGASVTEWCWRWRRPSLAFTLLLLPLMVVFRSNETPEGCRVYPFFILALTVTYFNIGSLMASRRGADIVRRLAPATFFIYGLHTIQVLGYSDRLMHAIVPLPALAYLLTPPLCAAICYLIYIGMHRLTPRLLALLTGGR